MKKRFWIALALILGCLLAGCPRHKEPVQPSVTFYYPRQEIRFDCQMSDGVIGSENRDAAGYENDPIHLIQLYLRGPVDHTLVNPFPKGTRLITAAQTEGTLTVKLTDALMQLEGIDMTIACACLSATCFAATDAQQVTIVCNQFTVTMDRGSLIVLDDTIPMQTAPENQGGTQ